MSAVKTVVLSVFAWGVVGTLAQADPIPWSSGAGRWSSWVPANTTTLSAVSNAPSNGSAVPTVTPTSTPTMPVLPTPPQPPPPPVQTPAPPVQIETPAPPVQTTPPPPVQTPTLTAPIIAPPPAALAPVAPTAVTAGASVSSAAPSGTADGFINFSTTGSGPEASSLTTGGGQAWYLSPSVEHVFGGIPNTQQQSNFAQLVLSDVNKTYSLAGMNPLITIDPSVQANHTLSVVSGTSYAVNPNAIGITDVGNNGFSFIDKLSYANSIQDLAWALAHNISHELMHAFGVAVHHDTTGNYLDAASASWSLLTNPNTTFSPAAAQDILAHNYGRTTSSGGLGLEVSLPPDPVPEPATIAFWTLTGAALLCHRRRKPTRAAAA
jgi:hypothetical protein